MTIQTISQQASSDLDLFYNTALPGVKAADYYPPLYDGFGGGPFGSGEYGIGVYSDITVRISYGAGEENDGSDAFGQVATCRIRISEVALVASGGKLIIDSDTWEVVYATKYRTGLEWIAEIHKR